jgi:hypothetical protein
MVNTNLSHRRLLRRLLPRIGFWDDDADRVLIESLEAAFAPRILQVTHDRSSPQNAFVGSAFERKIANRSTDI